MKFKDSIKELIHEHCLRQEKMLSSMHNTGQLQLPSLVTVKLAPTWQSFSDTLSSILAWLQTIHPWRLQLLEHTERERERCHVIASGCPQWVELTPPQYVHGP